ncbi:MAG TPA: hypothetical protein VIQ51_05140 [Chryseosolibacter sp.]
MRKPSGQIDDRPMRLLTTFTLLTICLTAIGQTFPTKRDSWYRVDTSFTKNDKRQKPLTYYPGTYVDTESKYTDSTGKSVIIQNSLPKGGVRYTDPTGKTFAYLIFWTRVINETDTPLELTINFPADSFPTFPSLESYLKLFLPPDTMTLNKESLYNYGVTDLEFFLDTGFNKPTLMQRTINAKEEGLFYVVALLYQVQGTARAGLVLKGQDLFYRINLLDSAFIPCGQIVFKN